MYTNVSYEKTDDNIYVNLVFNHSNPSFSLSGGKTITINSSPENIEYNVVKSTPYIDDASQYYASIIRFSIPLQSIPLYIMPIVPNQPNPNLTPFIIGITYNGIDTSENIIYIPDNLNIAIPTQIGYPVQNVTEYYYCYTYQLLINMINMSLYNVWYNSGIGTTFPAVSPPYYYIDYNTEIIHLIVPSILTEPTLPLVDIPKIFINEQLITYLQGFQYIFNGYGQPNGKDFILRLQYTSPIPQVLPQLSSACDENGNPISSTNPTYYDISQEYTAFTFWVSLKKIIITSFGLPIRSEFVPTNTNANSSINASYPIITDFVPNIEKASDVRTVAYYYPTAQYRLVDMIGNGSVNNVDLKVYWTDKLGNLYPISVGVNNFAEIKLAFFNKKLYNKTNITK